MNLTRELGATIGTVRACTALAVPRSSYYRRLSARPRPRTTPRPTPRRTLTPPERAEIVRVLNSERFADRSPRQVYAALLDADTYLCSIRTMYRILAGEGQVRERRNQLQHPAYRRPELVATAPNQVWSWDITKLLGPVKWTYFYLYVLLDIFSRYVVAYMVATRETSDLARQLIEEACAKHGIRPGQLTAHSDRGAPMTAKSTALLFADLGITESHSRPHVSNDNPYSEAQFKTLKYRPDFPDRFGSIQHARVVCRDLFDWYNNVHYHSGIGLLTPAVVHHGHTDAVLRQRDAVLARAYAAHPERFVARPPSAPRVPTAAWINPPRPIELASQGLPGQADPRSSILGHPGPTPLGQDSSNAPLELDQLALAVQ
jgi:putative transposase